MEELRRFSHHAYSAIEKIKQEEFSKSIEHHTPINKFTNSIKIKVSREVQEIEMKIVDKKEVKEVGDSVMDIDSDEEERTLIYKNKTISDKDQNNKGNISPDKLNEFRRSVKLFV